MFRCIEYTAFLWKAKGRHGTHSPFAYWLVDVVGRLNPQKDALFLETGDSGFANVVVIHPESEKKEELSILLDCLKSEKMEELKL